MKNIFYIFLTALISSIALLTTDATFDPELVYSTVILIWLLYIWYHVYANKRNYSE
ncbi:MULTISPECIES: hypothetical protein [Pedobacter]|uniref:Uncharacterized protein n=1 Tax=Pedobacter soli TaxID=390242 RepID=A0A1G6JCM2_9SPHI|nr:MULTISPECIES: hypothetical protein [Pedobacter]SDC16481.1 hypothetical protein SAMN04488024_101414 [Pedobacter soli]